MGETIGAYGYTKDDWKEKGYPLDLWIENNLRLFNQVSLVTYGHIKIPSKPNRKLKITELPISYGDRIDFDWIGKTIAQINLDTDWKVMSDIDEILGDRIDVTKLNKEFIYSLRIRNLYGNINTELIAQTSLFSVGPIAHRYAIHFGEKPISYPAAAGVLGRYQARIRPLRLFEYGVHKLFKTKNRPYFRTPLTTFDVWHTSLLRTKQQLFLKQMDHARIRKARGWEPPQGEFDFYSYGRLCKGSFLRKVTDGDLPKILLKNRDRFHIVDFPEKDYR